MNRPDLAGLTEEELTALTSPGLVQRARKELAGGALTAQVVEEEGGLRLEWSDGVVCRFPVGSSLRGGRCSCAAVEICRHLVRGVLYLKARGLIAGSVDMAEPAPDPKPPALVASRENRPKSKALPEPSGVGKDESLGRARRLLAEIFRGGLDGLSLGWSESARGTIADLRQAGLRRLPGLLAELADLIGADSAELPSQPDRLRWLLAALWLGVLGKFAQAPDPFSAERATGGPKPLRLFGLAAAGWKTDEVVGITLSLLERDTGAVLTVGTGRPLERGDTFGNLAARVPLLGTHTARDLLGRWVECSAARWTDHRVSLEAGAVASLLPERVDWADLGGRFGVCRFATVREAFLERFPSFAWKNALDVSLFGPRSWGEADYSAAERRFHWPMRDEVGEEIALVLWDEDEDRRAAIASLLSLSRRAPPRWVVGQARVQAGKVVVRPLTLVFDEGAGGRVHHVDLDFRKRDTATPKPLRPRRRDPRDPVFGPCDRWLDEILALGLASLTPERTAAARCLAREYRARNQGRLAVELERLAACAERGVDASHGDQRPALEALARVLIALELARESTYLEQGSLGSPEPGRAAS